MPPTKLEDDMRKLFVLLFLLIYTLSYGQTLGSRYYWQERFSITTAVTDTTFTDAYESCTIFSDTLDVDIKMGAPDTSNVTSQPYMRLQAGRSIELQAPLKLKRVYVKTINGTGYLYIVGIKKVSQF